MSKMHVTITPFSVSVNAYESLPATVQLLHVKDDYVIELIDQGGLADRASRPTCTVSELRAWIAARPVVALTSEPTT